jgi:hypothetical protein
LWGTWECLRNGQRDRLAFWAEHAIGAGEVSSAGLQGKASRFVPVLKNVARRVMPPAVSTRTSFNRAFDRLQKRTRVAYRDLFVT